MHLRKFDIARGDVPIGNVRAADPDDLPQPSPQPSSPSPPLHYLGKLERQHFLSCFSSQSRLQRRLS